MINYNLNKELRQRFSPEGSELRIMQLRLLDMLLWIDKLCKQYNIGYWISSGTCLGAVRHGGFIPWDDDIDIEMTIEDYKRFEKIISNLNKCPYTLQSHLTDPQYYHNFSKLRDERYKVSELSPIDKYYQFKGLFIDIFIVVPKNQYWITRTGGLWFGACRVLSSNKHLLIRKIVQYLLYPLGLYCIKPILLLLSRKDKSEYDMNFGMGRWMQRTVKDIQPPIPILFEGHYVMGPNNPDKYLKKLFGNYWEIPDINSIKRHIHMETTHI